jgi:hypothetical protein
MQRFPRKRKETRADKIFKTTAKDAAIAFVFKTIVPLIPLALIVYAVSFIVNLEITGDYTGQAQGLGVLNLNLKENKDELSGNMVLCRSAHYQIVDGKMLDDNRMEIHLSKTKSAELLAGVEATSELSKKSNPTVESDSKIEGGLVDNPSAASTTDATIAARKEQNDIRGTLQIDGTSSRFTASRSPFTALLGKRWINRVLDYFGVKIKI